MVNLIERTPKCKKKKSHILLKPFKLTLLTLNIFHTLFYILGRKAGDKFTKLSKIGFSMECFTADFFAIFYRKTSKFGFWVDSWVLAIKSKRFGDFLEIS